MAGTASKARRREQYNAMTQSQPQRQITLLLDDDAATRLRAVARLRGETLERTAQALLLSALASLASAPSAPSASAVAPIAAHLDDLDGSKAIEALLGTVHYPGVTGRVNTANEEIDRLIGEEAMNPHEDA